MSWTLSISPVQKIDWDKAVEDSVPQGQSLELPGVVDDVAVAKIALKAFGHQVKRDKVGGQASGHSLQPGDSANMWDSISVNAYGVE